jgi:thiaminase
MDVPKLLERHADRWDAAISHPFLDGVRDGTLPVAAFDTWLTQDFGFVHDLHEAFQSRLVGRAPVAAQPVLSGGVDALAAELDWFRGLAAERGLDLAAAPAAPEYRPLVEHWTTAGFAGYVGALQGLVEQTPELDIDDVLAKVLDQERAFWDMAMA